MVKYSSFSAAVDACTKSKSDHRMFLHAGRNPHDPSPWLLDPGGDVAECQPGSTHLALEYLVAKMESITNMVVLNRGCTGRLACWSRFACIPSDSYLTLIPRSIRFSFTSVIGAGSVTSTSFPLIHDHMADLDATVAVTDTSAAMNGRFAFAKFKMEDGSA